MNYTNPKDLVFKTPGEAKAFAKWYLGTSPQDGAEEEFDAPELREEYLDRRFTRLIVQADDLRKLTFGSPNKTSYKEQSFFRLAKSGHDPLSLIGSDKKSTRFNFKENPLFKNRVLYFGQDRDCCYTELFHADFMTQCYPEFELVPRAGELVRPKYKLYEYKLTVDDILVTTSSSTFKALGISESALKDEWYELNFEYNIPASSQIFGAIVRAQGWKGILYTSVRHQTKNNLVLFEDNTGDLESITKLVHESDFDLEQYEMNLGRRK